MAPSPAVVSFDATGIQGRAVSASEEASLRGKPAKTPIIAGTICGTIILVAWTVGAFIYFRKRYRRKMRKRLAAEGLAEPVPEKIVPPTTGAERVVIPPDPAVILGIAKPGDIAHPRAEPKPNKTPPAPHSRTGSVSSTVQQQASTTPTCPIPLTGGSKGAAKHGRSHSLSKTHPSPHKRTGTEDEIAPLNPHS